MFAAWILLYSACQFENVKDSYTVTFLNGLPLTILQKTCPFSSAPSAPTAANCYFALSLRCLRSSGSQGPCWAGALLGRAVCESIATRFPCPKKVRQGHLGRQGNSHHLCVCAGYGLQYTVLLLLVRQLLIGTGSYEVQSCYSNVLLCKNILIFVTNVGENTTRKNFFMKYFYLTNMGLCYSKLLYYLLWLNTTVISIVLCYFQLCFYIMPILCFSCVPSAASKCLGEKKKKSCSAKIH